MLIYDGVCLEELRRVCRTIATNVKPDTPVEGRAWLELLEATVDAGLETARGRRELAAERSAHDDALVAERSANDKELAAKRCALVAEELACTNKIRELQACSTPIVRSATAPSGYASCSSRLQSA